MGALCPVVDDQVTNTGRFECACPAAPEQASSGIRRPDRAARGGDVDATDLCYTSAIDLGRMIRSRELSPVELTDAVLARIERLNPKLNAFLTVTADLAREQARASEARALRSDLIGPLDGIPYSLKDLEPTAGHSDHLRLAVVRRQRPDRGRHHRRPTEADRRHPPGQDQHAEFWLQGHVRQHDRAAVQQSLAARSHVGRVVWRGRRGGRGRPGADRSWL